MEKLLLREIKVSIVIPCFNEKNNIQEIIKAVIDSPVPNKEIIVVMIVLLMENEKFCNNI